MNIRTVTVLACILAAMCSWALAADRSVTVIFLPFDVETVTPMTAENIHEQGRTFVFVGRHSFPDSLVALLQSKPTTRAFMANAVRLRVDFSGLPGTLLVDRNGVVFHRDRNASYELSRRDMRRIEDDIAKFVGVVDLRAYDAYRMQK